MADGASSMQDADLTCHSPDHWCTAHSRRTDLPVALHRAGWYTCTTILVTRGTALHPLDEHYMITAWRLCQYEFLLTRFLVCCFFAEMDEAFNLDESTSDEEGSPHDGSSSFTDGSEGSDSDDSTSGS